MSLIDFANLTWKRGHISFLFKYNEKKEEKSNYLY